MRKPFAELIFNFIYGIDKEELQKIGLERTNYRIFSGLYIIENARILKSEIPKIRKKLLEITSNEKFDTEIQVYAQKVYDSFDKVRKMPKVPFNRLIISFIYGVNQKSLEEIGLARNSYRIFAGIYLLKNVTVSKEAIMKYEAELRAMSSNQKFSHEIRDYSKKVLKSFIA